MSNSVRHQGQAREEVIVLDSDDEAPAKTQAEVRFE